MAVSEAQKRANKKYQQSHYEFLKIRLLTGEKEHIQQQAKEAGLSMNEYLRRKVLKPTG